MCEPATLTAISIGSTILSTAGGLYAQSQQAAAQEQYQNELAVAHQQNINETQQRANEAYYRNIEQLQERDDQNYHSKSRQIEANQKQAQAARATAITAAAEAGVAGLSVDALVNDYYGKEADYRNDVQTQYDYQQQDIYSRMEGARAQAENRGIAVYNASPHFKPVAQPDYLGAALRIGTGVYGAVHDNYGLAKRAQMGGQTRLTT